MIDLQHCAMCRAEIDEAGVALHEDGLVYCGSCAYEIERDFACPPVSPY